MGRKEKALARVRQNPLQVRFVDIDKVMRQTGFEVRHSGSHYVYSHPQTTGVVTIVRPHGKSGTQFVAPIYIQLALIAIDQLEEQKS